MKENKFIAIDIGASSGRIMLFTLGDTIKQAEYSRFKVTVNDVNGTQRIDIDKLINSIHAGIDEILVEHNDVTSIGVDTWAVDFVPIDKDGNKVDDPVFYRDVIFNKALLMYKKKLKDLYFETGVQIQPFNTYFQLLALEENFPIEKIDKVLLLPDYINYSLTKVTNTEKTNFSTTQIPEDSKKNDYFVKERESNILGQYKGIDVVSVASHDTASAFISIPIIDQETAFLSSGTWSLLGVESKDKVITEESYKDNFSNELNYTDTYRFQKNIMGMWIINKLLEELKVDNIAEVDELVEQSDINITIDINKNSFLNPQSMVEEFDKEVLEEFGIQELEKQDYFRIAINSLAKEYIDCVKQISNITGRKLSKLVIVGGGAKNKVLNSAIVERSGDLINEIYSIPEECSALGNVLVQAVEEKVFASLEQGRKYYKERLNIKRIK